MVRRLLLPLILLGAVALWASRSTAPPDSLREALSQDVARLSVNGLRLGDSTARVHEAWESHLKLDPRRFPGPVVLRWVDDYRGPTVGLSEAGTVVYVSGLSLEQDGTPLLETGEDTHLGLGPPDEEVEHEGAPDVWSYRLGEVDLELCLSNPDPAGHRIVFLVGLRDRRAPIRMGLYGQAVPTSGAGSSPTPSPAPSRR